jgi:hypothetical protein
VRSGREAKVVCLAGRASALHDTYRCLASRCQKGVEGWLGWLERLCSTYELFIHPARLATSSSDSHIARNVACMHLFVRSANYKMAEDARKKC